MEEIYLDHAATTPVREEVADFMHTVYLENFGNPSSVHSYGREGRKLLDEARSFIASSIGAKEKEIYFTSGGTESDNLALIGTALANRDKGNHIITTEQEHHAVLHAAQFLETLGFDVTYLPVQETGLVALQDLEASLREDTILVSIMFVNNETGVIQPIEEIGELLKDHQAYFHTDAVQAYGLIDIDVEKLAVDLLTTSAHKINGPKGIGYLYAAESVVLQALAFGGEQERKRRAGTENVAAIAGFYKAVELLLEEKESRSETYETYRETFIQQLKEENVSFTLNGNQENTVSTIVNISFPGTNVEQVLANLDLSKVAASSGSACTAGSVEPSHVLSAMFGENNPCTTNSIRFSFGSANTKENVMEAAKRVAKIIKRLTNEGK
jgi:cysteine desulfurase